VSLSGVQNALYGKGSIFRQIFVRARPTIDVKVQAIVFSGHMAASPRSFGTTETAVTIFCMGTLALPETQEQTRSIAFDRL
jgi:hypothetical protein